MPQQKIKLGLSVMVRAETNAGQTRHTDMGCNAYLVGRGGGGNKNNKLVICHFFFKYPNRNLNVFCHFHQIVISKIPLV